MRKEVNYLGIIGPLVALTCIGIAILLSPWFTWTGNALSDLGRYGNGLPAAVVFNAGLVTTALLMLVYVYFLILDGKDKWTKLGFVPLVVALVFLALIGVFSEDFGVIHFYVSVGFFASFPWSMWMTGFVRVLLHRVRDLFAVVSLILPFLSVYMWGGWYGGLFPTLTGNAIPEITTALSAIGWTWSIWFLRSKGELAEAFN
ncbi:MAG: DUF998 domain-containing protein [Candidatus Thorarchaeota archaeon]|nr:DUF998 domain-containing protein [Candidatus Thorarchaeota archaeon]